MMNPPYQDCHYNFRCYRDFLAVVPSRFRDVPVYITETNQYGPWLDAKNGWCAAAYNEVDDWNWEMRNQVIQALILYRYRGDQWHIEGKNNVIADFQHAQTLGHKWPQETDPPVEQPRIVSIRQTITLNWSDGTNQTFAGTLEEET
jgi:hypothetical protein